MSLYTVSVPRMLVLAVLLLATLGLSAAAWVWVIRTLARCAG